MLPHASPYMLIIHLKRTSQGFCVVVVTGNGCCTKVGFFSIHSGNKMTIKFPCCFYIDCHFNLFVTLFEQNLSKNRLCKSNIIVIISIKSYINSFIPIGTKRRLRVVDAQLIPTFVNSVGCRINNAQALFHFFHITIQVRPENQRESS